MSDTVKLIIEIPKEAKQAFDEAKNYRNLKCGFYDCGIIGKAIQNGIPLDSVKAEIKEKCDDINYIVSDLPYSKHRAIQELLCEILASIGNTESDLKGWTTEEMLEQIRKENNDNPEDIGCDHND